MNKLFFIAMLLFSSLCLAANDRVALVIGNSTYKNAPLDNPINDAADVSVKLKTLGFTVITKNNLTSKQIGPALREFRSKLSPGSTAVFYYAGHGVQIKGENYLPATDAEIYSEDDVPNQSLSMRQVIDVLEDSKTRLNLIFLDACRNNPYTRSFRGGTGGLAKQDAPLGRLFLMRRGQDLLLPTEMAVMDFIPNTYLLQ